jgi:hypothetical protein
MNEENIVNPHVKGMLLPIPGSASADLPIPFHQIGKKVFGLYHKEPLIILTSKQTSTAHPLINLKSISTS